MFCIACEQVDEELLTSPGVYRRRCKCTILAAYVKHVDKCKLATKFQEAGESACLLAITRGWLPHRERWLIVLWMSFGRRARARAFSFIAQLSSFTMQIKVRGVCAILAANRRKLFQLAHNRWQVSKAIFKFHRTRWFSCGARRRRNLNFVGDKLLRAFLAGPRVRRVSEWVRFFLYWRFKGNYFWFAATIDSSDDKWAKLFS